MNKVILGKNDLIQQVLVGKQTFESVLESWAQVSQLADELKHQNKKIKILVNLANVTKVNADALIASADAINSVPDAKIATFGGKTLTNKFANLVIAATGRSKTIRVFKLKNQALKWLSK